MLLWWHILSFTRHPRHTLGHTLLRGEVGGHDPLLGDAGGHVLRDARCRVPGGHWQGSGIRWQALDGDGVLVERLETLL